MRSAVSVLEIDGQILGAIPRREEPLVELPYFVKRNVGSVGHARAQLSLGDIHIGDLHGCLSGMEDDRSIVAEIHGSDRARRDVVEVSDDVGRGVHVRSGEGDPIEQGNRTGMRMILVITNGGASRESALVREP